MDDHDQVSVTCLLRIPITLKPLVGRSTKLQEEGLLAPPQGVDMADTTQITQKGSNERDTLRKELSHALSTRMREFIPDPRCDQR